MNLLKMMAYSVITMLSCVVMLVLASCIPRSAIQKQSEKSAEYFADREPFAALFGDYINSIQDNFSDTVLCDIAYCIDTSHPFSSIVKAEYMQGEYEDAYQGYLAAVNGEVKPNREYGRYWHGSLAFIRPLLMVMPIQNIRVLCGSLIIIMQLVITIMLIMRRKISFAVCWIIALLMVHPWMLFTSLEYGTAFLAASAASLGILLKKDMTDEGTMPFFAAVGIITFFVDFLTTETLTFTMPMLLLLERRLAGKSQVPGQIVNSRSKADTSFKKGKRSKKSDTEGYFDVGGCISVLKNGCSWLAGYLGMFAIKLVVLALVAGKDVLYSSLDEGFLRIRGEVLAGNFSTAPVVDYGKQLSGAIGHNIACLYPTHAGELRISITCLITSLIVAAGIAIVYLLHEKINWNLFFPMAIIAVIPYMRFLVLSNHSYIHFFITYRAQIVSLTVFFYFVFENSIKTICVKKS